MKHIIGTELDGELAQYLGKHKSTVASWKRRNIVPSKIIMEFCKKTGISLKEFDDNQTLNKVREKNVTYDKDSEYLLEMINRLRINSKKLHSAIGYIERLIEEIDK